MMDIEETQGSACCFLLKSPSGKTLFRSKDYSNKAAAEQAMEELPALLTHPGVIERKTDHEGRFLVLLKDLQGQPLGESQRYDSEAGMENGLKNILKLIREGSGK